jgi:hypothetical protein
MVSAGSLYDVTILLGAHMVFEIQITHVTAPLL